MSFFKNKKIEKIHSHLSQVENNDYDWVAVYWNMELDQSWKRSYSIEVSDSSGSSCFAWRFIEDDFHLVQSNVDSKRNQVVIHSKDAEKLINSFNFSIHQTIIKSLDTFKSDILTPVVGATTQNLQDEARALEWIKTSFRVLVQALEKIESDKDLILTSCVLAGKDPKTNKKLLRLIAMNLDILFYFEEDYILRVVVYDDKNQGHSSSLEPVFNQIIKVTKPQFYDEMIKIVNKVALAGDFSC